MMCVEVGRSLGYHIRDYSVLNGIYKTNSNLKVSMAPNTYIQEDLMERGAVPVHRARRAWSEKNDKCTNEFNISRESAQLLDDSIRAPEWSANKISPSPELTHDKLKPNLATRWEKNKPYILSLMKPPLFITLMVVVMILMHPWTEARERTLLEWSPGPWWRQPWRLLTYGIIHSDVAHLSLNAFMALVVGWSVEREQGWWRVGALWAGGLAAGALGVGLLQPEVRVVGASGAVFALLTSHIPNVCLRYGYIGMSWFRILSVLVLCASELVHHCILKHYLQAESVAWSSHWGGAAAGILLGFVVYSGENHNRRSLIICHGISVVLITSATCAAVYYYFIRYSNNVIGYYRSGS